MTERGITDRAAQSGSTPRPFRAVVLGAGRGTRLAPLTERVPKILAPVAGLPLLEHQLRYLECEGATEVAVNAHHLADAVSSFVRNRHERLPVRVSVEPELLGTAGALLPLRDFLTETFVVLYGDVLSDVDLQQLLAAHRRRSAIATVVYTEDPEMHGKGLLVVEPDGRVSAFLEKPEEIPKGAVVSSGIYVLEPAILEYVSVGADFGFDVFPAALAAGRPVYGFNHDGYLCDVGSPTALDRAERDLAAGALRW